MRKGKFEFKTGRSLKGTPCIPMGTDAELKKIPEGALGYNPETGALSIKNAAGLTQVGKGTAIAPEPPEPPQPDANSLIFVITDANTVESEGPAANMAVHLGVDWLDENGFDATCIDEATGTELEYDVDWKMGPAAYYQGYSVNINMNENFRGPFRLTFRGNMEQVGFGLIFTDGSDSSTFIETVSFGGVRGGYNEEFGMRTIMCGYEHKISSWQGLHNTDGLIMWHVDGSVLPLLSIPDSLARLAHLKYFVLNTEFLQSGGRYGYTEFAKNKQLVRICAPYWEGDASAMKAALENEGYVLPEEYGESVPVFDNTWLADGFFDIPEPWAGSRTDNMASYPPSLMGLVYKKYGSLKGLWEGASVDVFNYYEGNNPEYGQYEYMEIQAHRGAGNELEIINASCEKEEWIPGYSFWFDSEESTWFTPAVPDMRNYINEDLRMVLGAGYGTTIIGHPQGASSIDIYGHLVNYRARYGNDAPIYVMHIPGGMVSGHDTAYDEYVKYNYSTKKWEYLN